MTDTLPKLISSHSGIQVYQFEDWHIDVTDCYEKE